MSRESAVKAKASHIKATVYFLPTEDGGRKTPAGKQIFLVPFLLNGSYYDCVLKLFDVGPMRPGQTAEIPIVFMCPQRVIPLLKHRSKFELWEGRTIAKGTVTEIFWRTSTATDGLTW